MYPQHPQIKLTNIHTTYKLLEITNICNIKDNQTGKCQQMFKKKKELSKVSFPL